MPARRRTLVQTAAVLSVALTLAACASPANSPLPSPSVVAPSSEPPASASVDPSGEPSVAPSVAPTPSPSLPHETPTPATGTWSKPVPVPGLDGCVSVVAVIDDVGGRHLAADCAVGDRNEIRLASTTDGSSWTTTTIASPSNRLERDPQLAVDGSTLYVGYTRLAQHDGGCGDDGLTDVGVYVRTRALPSGAWSDARQIGVAHDELQSLRVVDGVVYATVGNDLDGKAYYESVRSDASAAQERVAIPGATGSVALRIGDDAVARIAHEATGGIAYGSVSGGAVHESVIPGTTDGWSPVVILEPGNVADILWNHSYHGLGCAEPDPVPEDGTYFSTNAGGAWQTTKLADIVGTASMTFDPSTRTIHAVVSDFGTVVAFDRPPEGGWTHTTLAARFSGSPVIRQDPVTGELVVVFVRDVGSQSGIDVMTRS